ncbi:uncharacterized protein LOC119020572 isoform X1 [Acanthopagrus latus]|uniref:uncharacterized protein LOC119020572 isoform X1 n=1 Tax=Acanthopagrus latus TaxID=8177 RepID=UPI00187C1B13|nr:uncharacterized protein LOC119020572 isoform X1 [Acanthopagrus latus]
MRTSVDLCFCLLVLCGLTSVLYGVEVFVEEDSDAVLPCLISTEDLTGKIFDWKKDGQKEVFIYRSGLHSNNGFPGQDEQFKGRVSHFQDQLKNGNASIKIQNTKMADSGSYRCLFPLLEPRQTFYIELVVGRSLTDQSAETTENPSTKAVAGLLFGGIIIGAFVLAAVQALLVATKRITVTCNQATTPHDMKQDHDCRASEDRADTEPTPSSFREWIMISCDDLQIRSTTPHDMKQDHDCRASEDRADTELTERNGRDPGDEEGPLGCNVS